MAEKLGEIVMRKKIKSITLAYVGTFIGWFIINLLVLKQIPYIKYKIAIFIVGYIILILISMIVYAIINKKKK